MNARDELMERVRSGGQAKLVNLIGQIGRDGRIFCDTPPSPGVQGHPHLTAVEVVDKQRYPYLWDERDMVVALVIYEREPTPEEMEQPNSIWID